jgi:hypothetical protein
MIVTKNSLMSRNTRLLKDFWAWAGNLNVLYIEKCQVLKGRDVMLYHDLKAFEKWNEKVKLINYPFPSQNRERNSTILEEKATDFDRESGLDIADYNKIVIISLSDISQERLRCFLPSFGKFCIFAISFVCSLQKSSVMQNISIILSGVCIAGKIELLV